MADLPENPNNREEEYLADLAGQDGAKPNKPWSRKEAYLDAIDGRMDGIDVKIAALATDISFKGSVPTVDDLPETAAVGDAYITEDTGIMYVYVGESGTEPWVALGGSGGGIKELTEADYNYPTSNPQAIAMWLLDSGYYKVKYTNGVQPKIISGTSMSSTYDYNDGAILPIWDAFNAKVSIWSNYNATGTLIKSYLVYSSGLGSYAYSQELTPPTVVQTTGTSTTSVMSQNATSRLLFPDETNHSVVAVNATNAGINSSVTILGDNTTGGYNNVCIGYGSRTSSFNSVALGLNAKGSGRDTVAIGSGTISNARAAITVGTSANVGSERAIAIGENARAAYKGSIALGSNAITAHIGEINVSTTSADQGYNGNSTYRLLTGLYDPQSAHDAATKGYVDTLVGNIESALHAINNGGNA